MARDSNKSIEMDKDLMDSINDTIDNFSECRDDLSIPGSPRKKQKTAMVKVNPADLSIEELEAHVEKYKQRVETLKDKIEQQHITRSSYSLAQVNALEDSVARNVDMDSELCKELLTKFDLHEKITGMKITDSLTEVISWEKEKVDLQYTVQGEAYSQEFLLKFCISETKNEEGQVLEAEINKLQIALDTEIGEILQTAVQGIIAERAIHRFLRFFRDGAQLLESRKNTFESLQARFPHYVFTKPEDANTTIYFKDSSSIEWSVVWDMAVGNDKVESEISMKGEWPSEDQASLEISKAIITKSCDLFEKLLETLEPEEAISVMINRLCVENS